MLIKMHILLFRQTNVSYNAFPQKYISLQLFILTNIRSETSIK